MRLPYGDVEWLERDWGNPKWHEILGLVNHYNLAREVVEGYWANMYICIYLYLYLYLMGYRTENLE